MEMSIIIVMLLCLIILLMFAIYDKVTQKDDTPKIENLQVGQASQRDIDIFRQGLQQNWMFVNISLYKMWNDLDILDFESIQNKLQQTLENLTKDSNEMSKWSEKFKEYLKEQKKD